MWLVLCSAQDNAALWAYSGLKQRGLHPLELLTDEMLACCLRMEHRIAADTAPLTRMVLTDGRAVESSSIQGVLNRLFVIPTRHIAHAQDIDRQYAEQELSALFLSWLNGLPGHMFNRPSPQGLSGAWRHRAEWMWLAGQVGLPALPYRQSDIAPEAPFTEIPLSDEHCLLITFKGKCFGPSAPAFIQEKCLQLAQLSKTAILGLEFDLSSGKWLLCDITPMADLRVGGARLLDELTSAFCS